MKKFMNVALLAMLTACSTMGPKKVVVDSSSDRPSWVSDNKMTWDNDSRIYFKAKVTVRGDQRLNGCYNLASNDNREAMLRSIVDELKGATDEAQTDLNENAESLLGKVRSGKWAGKIYGFKDHEQYFERFQIRDEGSGEKTERQDCYTLSYISKSDYNRTLQELVNKIAAVDPRLREAITQKQIGFFGDTDKLTTDRKAASIETPKAKTNEKSDQEGK